MQEYAKIKGTPETEARESMTPAERMEHLRNMIAREEELLALMMEDDRMPIETLRLQNQLIEQLDAYRKENETPWEKKTAVIEKPKPPTSGPEATAVLAKPSVERAAAIERAPVITEPELQAINESLTLMKPEAIASLDHLANDLGVEPGEVNALPAMYPELWQLMKFGASKAELDAALKHLSAPDVRLAQKLVQAASDADKLASMQSAIKHLDTYLALRNMSKTLKTGHQTERAAETERKAAYEAKWNALGAPSAQP